MSLIALDVEGTLITSTPISSQIKDLLAFFHHSQWIIVLATSAYGQKLEDYKIIFQNSGISQFIDSYSPLGAEPQDSKYQKLEKYRAQYNMYSKDKVYFFDDLLSNIIEVQSHGYCYCFHVTSNAPLEDHLAQLRNNLDQL